ncbi:unnamed protein product [Rotaria sordida]|uniref:F-box domain-containing protein n=2 Tax=Rotaria sordida TaxID=392033 RepID=A0A815ART6_9BILA|nr:unnamed protein product [Rotaria sordida]
MQRTKQQEKDIEQNLRRIQKLQLENSVTKINSIRYTMEDFPNEIFYEIFEYLDLYDIYKGFYNLNTRFRDLTIHANVLTKINPSIMSNSNFKDYYQNIVKPNQKQINFLRLINPFAINIIFPSPRTILNFNSLETLILDNLHNKKFDEFFDHFMHLPNLHSLNISLTEGIKSLYILFCQIFRLPKLKYCKIEYYSENNEEPLYIDLNYNCSSIEHLIINGPFPFNTFNNLLCCLPKLKHLSMNSIVGSQMISEIQELSPIELKYFKHISLKIDYIHFGKFEKIIKDFFHHVQTLHLTIIGDKSSLDAKQYQELITSYMPYLRIFDINHEYSIGKNDLTYHDIINQFNSSFWIENKWFFTHQHRRTLGPHTGIFYSTAPYRRKYYTYYLTLNNEVCSHIQENVNSVKHLHIVSQGIQNNVLNYFPNVNQLSIRYISKKQNESTIAILQRIVPLKQLTTLFIKYTDLPVEYLIKLLYFAPNVHTLNLIELPSSVTDLKLIKENETSKCVSNMNKIENLTIRRWITFYEIPFILHFFPKLKYLKTQILTHETRKIIRLLLSETRNRIRNLLYLCIPWVSKRSLKEIKFLIKSEKLLHNYSIIYVNETLHLWW